MERERHVWWFLLVDYVRSESIRFDPIRSDDDASADRRRPAVDRNRSTQVFVFFPSTFVSSPLARATRATVVFYVPTSAAMCAHRL